MLFSPYLVSQSKQYYRFFTYGLIHADWLHLLINMFVLNSFGKIVEHDFEMFFFNGKFYYIILYVCGTIVAVVPSYFKYKANHYYNAVGASGAVSAVIFSSIIIHPFDSGIMIFPLPLTIPAIIFGILYLIYSVYMDKKGQDNVGHNAHFWGAIFGILYTIMLKPSLVLRFIKQFLLFFSTFI